MPNPPKETQGYRFLDSKELENEDRWYVPEVDSDDDLKTTQTTFQEYLRDLVPTGWKAAEITLSRVNKWGELDNQTAERSDEKFIELTKKLWARDIATHWKKEGVKFSDLDGQASLFLLKVAGIKPKEVEYLEHGQSVEGKINIDTGDVDGVRTNFGEQKYKDPAQQAKFEKTTYIDHHGESRAIDTSAAKFTYETLLSLGMIERSEALDKMVEYVTRCDNKDFPEIYYKNYDQSHRTLYGLAGFVRSLETLFQFFKDGKDPLKPMTDEELRTYDFIRRGTLYDENNKPLLNADGTQKQGWVNYSEVRRERIKEAQDAIAVLRFHGFVIDSDGFGKTIISLGAMRVDVDTAVAEGFDTTFQWNPDDNGFSLSAIKGLPEDFELPQGRRVRGQMWIKPRNAEALMPLDEILKKMVGNDFEARGDLKTYIETGKLTPELQKLMKGTEVEEEIPPVVEPEEPDTREFLDASFESKGTVGKDRDEFIRSIKAIVAGTSDKRLVREDAGGKLWQFKKLESNKQNPNLVFVRFYGRDGSVDETVTTSFWWEKLVKKDESWYLEKREVFGPPPPPEPPKVEKETAEAVELSDKWELRGNTDSSFRNFTNEVNRRKGKNKQLAKDSPLVIKNGNEYWYFTTVLSVERGGMPIRFLRFDPVTDSQYEPREQKKIFYGDLKRLGLDWYTLKTVAPIAPTPVEEPVVAAEPPAPVEPTHEETGGEKEVFGPPELYGPPPPPQPQGEEKLSEKVELSDKWEKQNNFGDFVLLAMLKFHPRKFPLVARDKENNFWILESIQAFKEGMPMIFLRFDPVSEQPVKPREEKMFTESSLKGEGADWYQKKAAKSESSKSSVRNEPSGTVATKPAESTNSNASSENPVPEVKSVGDDATDEFLARINEADDDMARINELSHDDEIVEAETAAETNATEVTPETATAERADVEEAEAPEFVLTEEEIRESLQPGFRWKLSSAAKDDGEIFIKSSRDDEITIKAANLIPELRIKAFLPNAPIEVQRKHKNSAEVVIETGPSVRIQKVQGKKELEEYLIYFGSLVENYYPIFKDKRFGGLGAERYKRLRTDLMEQYLNWYESTIEPTLTDILAEPTNDTEQGASQNVGNESKEPAPDDYTRVENAVRPGGIVLYFMSGPIVIKPGQEWHFNFEDGQKLVRIDEVEFVQSVQGAENVNWPNDGITIRGIVIADGVEAPFERLDEVKDWALGFKAADEFDQHQNIFKDEVKEIG